MLNRLSVKPKNTKLSNIQILSLDSLTRLFYLFCLPLDTAPRTSQGKKEKGLRETETIVCLLHVKPLFYQLCIIYQ